MSKRTLIISIVLLLKLSLTAAAERPRRVIVLVFDQMRAEYIERYDLPNFQRAQAMGLTFENGIVGHLESNTVISHPVITSGHLPKNLPWAAQIWEDSRGLFGPKNSIFTPYFLSTELWLWSMDKIVGTDSLLARVKEKNPGPTFAVAQKKYAAFNYGGPYADSIVCLGPVLKEGTYTGHHTIGGVNVPEYISQPEGNRFYLEGLNTWGSDVERYSFTGDGYVTGSDPFRPGGDAWVGDVVEKIMTEEPEWSAILASFGAVDKIAHVLAEHDEPTDAAWALKHDINLEDTLKKADIELGRILDRLQRKNLLQETVLVITADHGGQKNSNFLGRNRPGKHKEDSYYGKAANFDFTYDPHPALQPLIQTGLLRAVTMDTMILVWTETLDQLQTEEMGNLVSQMPGVTEVYRKVKNEESYAYERVYRNPKLRGDQLAWARLHNEKLANSFANEGSPQFMATLFDDTGYALIGAHGGTQEMLQRIPMIVVSQNLARGGATSDAWARLCDINPMVSELMGLPARESVDGSAKPVIPFVKD